MIRFVDVRFQGLQARFALWDAVTSSWISLAEAEAWETWEDLVQDLQVAILNPDQAAKTIKRIGALCPPWVHTPPTDEELDFREGPIPKRLSGWTRKPWRCWRETRGSRTGSGKGRSRRRWPGGIF